MHSNRQTGKRDRRISGLLLLALAIGLPLSLVPEAEAAPIRVLALGDSLTKGTTSTRRSDGVCLAGASFSYRRRLLDDLARIGLDIAYVGSQRQRIIENNVEVVLDHEGIGGISIAGIRTQNAWNQFKPDVILLMTGTNNRGQPLATAKADLGDLITDIMRDLPDVELFVASIPSVIVRATPPRYHPFPPSFNSAIVDLLAELANPKVHFVDAAAPLKWDDPNTDPFVGCDGVHLASGNVYELMAPAWLDALVDVFLGIRATRFWVGDSGAWDDSLNWARTEGGPPGDGPPSQGTRASLTQSDTTTRIITYRSSDAPWMSHLIVDTAGNGTMTLSQPRDTLRTVLAVIGRHGSGDIVQIGGLTEMHSLIIGNDRNSEGAYVLGGIASLTTIAEVIGFSGTGEFVQEQGDHTVLRQMILGFTPPGRGAYTLRNGTLETAEELVGVRGTATFTQFGGTNAVLGALEIVSDPECAEQAGECTRGRGTYRMLAGELTAGRIINNDTFHYTGGDIQAAITNNGSFQVVGPRTIAGPYVQNGPGRLGLELVAPGNTNRLTITGDATFAGGVITINLGDIDPQLGDQFDILAARQIVGFRAGLFRLPRLSGIKVLRANLVDDATTVRLTVVSADLDNSGGVDCGDLAIVRASLGKRSGQAGFDSRADVNGDAVIDVRDMASVAQKLAVGTTCR